jgi:aminocarboxymuconate-semialdehyde decarboxylase
MEVDADDGFSAGRGEALYLLAGLVGIDRLVLGTDYSLPPADPFNGLRAVGFSAADGWIANENPRRLFSQLAK